MQINFKKILTILPIALTLVATITAIMTWVNLTPSQSFITTWLKALGFGVSVMLPLGALTFILIKRVINRWFGSFSTLQKNILQGILMAFTIESILAIATTLSGNHYHSLSEFISLSFNSLIYALPVGLTFALLVNILIKPRIEQKFTQA